MWLFDDFGDAEQPARARGCVGEQALVGGRIADLVRTELRAEVVDVRGGGHVAGIERLQAGRGPPAVVQVRGGGGWPALPRGLGDRGAEARRPRAPGRRGSPPGFPMAGGLGSQPAAGTGRLSKGVGGRAGGGSRGGRSPPPGGWRSPTGGGGD